VKALEAQGLVRRIPDLSDKRVVRVEASEEGRALLYAGRERRVAALADDVARLSEAERATVVAAIPMLERLAGR
jgi:DNA-binding MarR family transcriptional regulator